MQKIKCRVGNAQKDLEGFRLGQIDYLPDKVITAKGLNLFTASRVFTTDYREVKLDLGHIDGRSEKGQVFL